jgi:kynurenine formamidase
MAEPRPAVIELSHVVEDGSVTLPGYPAPRIGTFLSREASRAHYAPGVEFHIATIEMIANTGTYLDTPFHRYPETTDLAGIDAARLLEVPGLVVRAPVADGRAIGIDRLGALAAGDVAGRAVLVHTGWDVHFGTPAYGIGHPYLTAATVRWLADAGPAVVGIDSLNIDDTQDGRRPAHSTLLGAGIPILEHLTNLASLPDRGFRLTALPARFRGVGTFPVRAVARLG